MVRTALEYLLFKVDEIHLDILNAHLQFVTPFLRRNGVEYERDRFVEKLDAGTMKILNMQVTRLVVLERSTQYTCYLDSTNSSSRSSSGST
jgi:T-complex protein 11